MKAVAAGALSIAASAALQFSEVGGPIPTILAAATAAMLAVYLIFRGMKDRTEDRSVFGLGERCQRLGNELVLFARRRMSESPGQTGKHAHETDTATLFANKYAHQATTLLRELVREGCMGAEEANAWMAPDNAEAIELLGRRFLQLGLAAD